MFFEQRLIGSMANFGYVFGDPATKAAAVMDPSFDAQVLQKAAAENGYSIGLIFNTHHHVDHVFDNERLANESGRKIAADPARQRREELGPGGGRSCGATGPQRRIVPPTGPASDSPCLLASGRGLARGSVF